MKTPNPVTHRLLQEHATTESGQIHRTNGPTATVRAADVDIVGVDSGGAVSPFDVCNCDHLRLLHSNRTSRCLSTAFPLCDCTEFVKIVPDDERVGMFLQDAEV